MKIPRTLSVLTTAALLVVLMPGGVSDDRPSEPADDIVRDQVVVRFHEAIPADIHAQVDGMGDMIQHVPDLRFITLQVDPDEAAGIMGGLAQRSDVESVYHPGRVHALYTPNDPLLSSQWGVPAIGMEAAWEHGLGSHLAKVAVLDTGTDYGHEDLTPNTSMGNPLCGPDHTVVGTTAADDHFHGTHVAGTVAGVIDNEIGVSGMGNSCVQTVKVLNSGGGGTWEGVAEGVNWATLTGAHFISMSLGGGGGSPVLEDAVNQADAAGVLVIAAAGNSGCWGGDSVLYPAKYDVVMAVAALAPPGNTRASFSSCGPAVEISAPGQNVISARINGGYWYLSGTSMATPHVSGVAGLIKATNLLLSNNEIRCLLIDTADDLGDPGRDNLYGHGGLDAAEAVARAAAFSPDDPCDDGNLLPIPLPL